MASRVSQIAGHLSGSSSTEVSADYVLLGGGALGLGFADVLLKEDPAATILCVDRAPAVGGHWQFSYPFVRLHQPSVLYGAASLPLGADFVETHGRSKGMLEMASGAEILAYYDKLYREILLPTGRFTFLSLHEMDWASLDLEWKEGGVRCTATSLVTGDRITLKAYRKFVDSTYEQVTVPSQRLPPFAVDPAVRCLQLGLLPEAAANGWIREAPRICIFGAGKTGIDAVLWLLDRGIPPDRLSWVMPRDQYFYPREALNPLVPAFQPLIGRVESETRKAIRECGTPREFLDRLLACGGIVQLDPDDTCAPEPTMFHGCSVTTSEISAMRSVKDIIRKGRCTSISPAGLHFPSGLLHPMPPGTLYIDGTNPRVAPNPPIPVFIGRKITIQMVLRLHPTFSTALLARLESDASLSISQKNAMSATLPHCDAPWEILLMRYVSNRNAASWMRHEPTRNWLAGCRLFGGWLKAKPARGKAGEKAARAIVEAAEGEEERLGRLVEMARRGVGV